MAMTVSEMADRAAKRGVKKPAFVERVRHWTREGLLEPIGELNPGTGRHRRYDDSALEDALILNALADFGIPIGIQRTALILARDAKTGWREKVARGHGLFLEIARLPNGQQFAHCPEHKSTLMGNGLAEQAIVFDLAKIFSAITEE